MIQLNLGCWHRNIPGFINIDLCDMPHIHYKTSIDKLDMFENESVDLIYSSHSLEYFDRFQVIDVLREWKRVLKQGGRVRLAVPDFDQLIKVYCQTNDINKILGPLYGRMEIDTKNGKKCLYHKTVYNFQSLSEILINNGFNNIRRYDWRNTIHKDYDDHSQAYYPHMDKENGILISLNVEAIKKD
ncbi:class I SAM-dependent methyltransferase [Campylobacter coli]|uniref:class I SAM-dependent methyltransferase n=1 Tax=Campylobacter coli TaxID=195 RepID=UPI001C92E00C|nr:methyltransferase domain-containing protein [Campylobacter coli]